MSKKSVVVDIEDLREFVGGAAGDVKVADRNAKASPGLVTSTVMCYRFSISQDTGETWTKVSGK